MNVLRDSTGIRPHHGVGVIYVFADDDGDIVYVGQTRKDFRRRHMQHLQKAEIYDNPFSNWLRTRLQAGHIPSMYVLEIAYWAHLNEREQYWIKKLSGPKLLNIKHVVECPKECPF